MSSIKAISPFLLLGSWPFVSFLNTNRTEQNYYVSTVILWVLAIALGVALLLLVRRVVPRLALTRLSSLAGIACVLFFSFDAVRRGVNMLGFDKPREEVFAWLAVFLVGSALTWWLSRAGKAFPAFVVFGLVLVAVPGAQLALFQVEVLARGNPDVAAVANGERQQTVTRQPNVYWLVLDAYPRVDVLWGMHEFDNNDFVDAMKERDFQYIANSYSNYSGTVYSLSTTLNMDYYLDGKSPPFNLHVQPKLEGDNRTWNRFKALGYSIIHASMGGGGRGKTFCKGSEDICIVGEADGALGLDDAQVALLALTPIHTLAQRFNPVLLSHRKMTVEFVRSWLREHDPKGPYFLFAHILSPHGPKRFGDDCAYLESGLRSELVKDPRKYVASVDMPNDVRCLNPRVIGLIDDILAADRSDPIIIVQGDHGDATAARGYDNFDEWLASDGPRFTFGHLNLMRLPEPCKGSVPDSMTAVDTFRLVFSCLEDKPFTPLPRRQFAEGEVHGFGDGFREIQIIVQQ